MAARSTRWPPACCRSPSAPPPRPCPTSWTAPSSTASPCASARRATPTTPTAQVTATTDVRPTDAEIRGRAARLPRRHHADPAGLLRHQGRRRARLRHGPRGPRPGAGAPRPPGSTASSWSSAPTPTRRSSRSHPARASTCAASPATWPRACGTLGHIAALRRLRVGPFTEAQAIPLDKLARTGRYRARFPGPPASGRDRAGRHPGAGPDRSGGRRPRHGQAISLVALMGRIPADGRSRWGIGPRHGGGPRDRAVPAGGRLAEARTDALSPARVAQP